MPNERKLEVRTKRMLKSPRVTQSVLNWEFVFTVFTGPRALQVASERLTGALFVL